jgi:hypothetical protein
LTRSRTRRALGLAGAGAAALAVSAGLLPAQGAVASTRPAIARNHQFRLDGARWCMRVKGNGGRNSLMVLGPCADTAAADVTFLPDGSFVAGFPVGRLDVVRKRDTCVGTDPHRVEARTIRCQSDTSKWVRLPLPRGGVAFVNWAAHFADPLHNRYLLAPARLRGLVLAVGTNTGLPHGWRGQAARHRSAARGAEMAVSAQRAAACQASQVLAGTTQVRGRAKIRSFARVTCAHRPRSFHAQLRMLRRQAVRGHLRWVTVSRTREDAVTPSPARSYTLLRACRPGTYRTRLAIGGSTSPGHQQHATFDSVPVTVRNCVSGNAAAAVTTVAARQAAPLLAGTRAPHDLVADCDAQVHMLKRVKNTGLSIWIYRQAKAHAFCSPEPRTWNSQIIMQRWNKGRQGWDWIGAGPVRHAVPRPDKTYWLNKPCGQGRFRAGLGVWGTSSTGQYWSEAIQWSKVLRIANCRA